jgi:FtsP/CotA-like multicopper oxidase with cupredoxin domain
MAEHEDVNMQNDEQAAPATRQSKAFAARRRFLRQALAAASGVALAELLPFSFTEGSAQQLQCSPGQPLVPIGEITSNGNTLQAVLKVVNGARQVPTVNGNKNVMLRYYSGYNSMHNTQGWPPNNRLAPGPGPTFRCKLGDQVQIAFMNKVNVSAFPASTFNGENGTSTGCDEGTTNTDQNWYPMTTGDLFPNCFHASSAANVHFHGLHVSPSTTGDNVLVNIWPNVKQQDGDVLKQFAPIFTMGSGGRYPQQWSDLPQAWRDQQMGPNSLWPQGKDKGVVGIYDDTAQYGDGRGLPPALRLWPVNYHEIENKQWPQYYVGAYPYCFYIPRYDGSPTGLKMGQAPGTHWYHSHKHGSTSINLFNGMSGAFIIEDPSPTGYDGKLKNFEQVVLVLQQITAVTNLLTSGAGAAPVLVNGQQTPLITMRPGQIQLWRVVNACVQKAVTFQFDTCNTNNKPPVFRRTAQDGVQLDPVNYTNLNQPPFSTVPLVMAPANRVDALVQAPMAQGTYVFGTAQTPLAFIKVEGTPLQMNFPTQAEFPEMPKFLGDIKESEIKKSRTIIYGWEPGRTGPGRNADNQAPYYTINGKQFTNGVVNEVMQLNTAEEWTMINLTTVAHPFHIHVNPFQIIEIFDPNNNPKPVRVVANEQELAAAKAKWGDTKDYVIMPAVWWDNFAIPIALRDSNRALVLGPSGYAQTPGYFTMRSRFVDFTGVYVQHCHILAHEDRGMMQLLQVCEDPNSQACKKQQANIKHH